MNTKYNYLFINFCVSFTILVLIIKLLELKNLYSGYFSIIIAFAFIIPISFLNQKIKKDILQKYNINNKVYMIVPVIGAFILAIYIMRLF